MRKTYPLHIEGKNPDRVLDATKHDIRKYLKRERRRDLPEGMDFWDFDCKFGATEETAQYAHLATITELIDAVVRDGGKQFYVEIIARAAKRAPRPAGAAAPQDEAGFGGEDAD